MGLSELAPHAVMLDFGILDVGALMKMDVYSKGAENERITKSLLPSHSRDCILAS